MFFRKTYARMRAFSGGEVVQRLSRDPYGLRTLVAITPVNLLAQVSAFGFLVVLMVRISPALSMVCAGLGILGAVFPLLFMRALARLDEAKKNFEDCTAGIELEMVQNRSFFQSYGIEDFAARKQGETFRHFDETYLRRGVWTEALAALLPAVCLLLGTLAFLGIGVFQARAGEIGAGDLVAFFSYLTIATGIVTKVCNQGRQMVQLPQTVERIVALTDGAARTGGADAGAWETICARGLAYRYGEDRPPIAYRDFDIARNSLVEIRGNNGAGKTTLIRLITGLLTPGAGMLRVDGLRMEEIDLAKWRDGIACVEQSPTIFEGTLRENILIGNPGAPSARVDEVLARLELSAQAERAVVTARQLSGGELKKIALGRALLRDANLLILDEPYAHLDRAGRKIVADMLADETKTRICILHGDGRGEATEERSLSAASGRRARIAV